MVDKLTRIDTSLLADHVKLTINDECYFWREYTSGRNYLFGPGNDLISNLKKKPSISNVHELRHKERVIAECSQFFSTAINMDWLKTAVLVPIPGSKIQGHPDYDDRLIRVCRGIRSNMPLDIRCLVRQNQSSVASHESGNAARLTVEELLELYEIDETLIPPEPKNIAIFDDVLTAGTHYCAMQIKLSERFPNARIVGFFVARRVLPPDGDCHSAL
ncbi:hypothetical protein [Pseudochrobactrum saccharolyticum]|uniref:hypothetical protein n=1 Tax=Pseudochrobactrum saccharolyticum TaxID=354352 RepID=UPI00274C3AEA|nr:hypothetical protein [Pseudochrobactrum saccharolyticum]MDP8250691.1 hypothetical protein [Pseudochrobactrum saccharolyticum]